MSLIPYAGCEGRWPARRAPRPGTPQAEARGRLREIRARERREKKREALGPGQRLIDEIAAWHMLDPEVIRSMIRYRHVVEARQECCYRLVVDLGYSLTRAGNLLKRDHTTVLHSMRRHCERTGDPMP